MERARLGSLALAGWQVLGRSWALSISDLTFFSPFVHPRKPCCIETTSLQPSLSLLRSHTS